MAVIRVFWRALRHIYLRGYIYVWANLLWVVLSLPIITAPAAWAALVHTTYIAQTQPTVSLEDYWEGFKAHPVRDIVIGLVLFLVLFINLSNLAAYPLTGKLPRALLNMIWISAVTLALSIYFYIWPVMEAMQAPTIFSALRNAVLMTLKNPFFTLGILLVTFIMMAISTILFPLWLLLTGSSIAVLTTTAALDRLGIVSDDRFILSPTDDATI
jgi:uncharacterized membrane protein YesL